MKKSNFSVDKNDFFINLSHNDLMDKDNHMNSDYIDFMEVKEEQNRKRFNVNNTFKNDLVNLFQWQQFNRHLTTEGISDILKRHFKVLSLFFIGFWLLFKSDTQPSNIHNLSHQSANVFSIEDFPDYFSVSEEERIAFIERYARIAIAEMNKFQIPASITLAIAIVNSNYGFDNNAIENSNLFALKCSENKLTESVVGHYEEDGECFVKYKNNWTSFRANSQRFTSREYASLVSSANNNYRLWLEKLEMLSFPNIEAIRNIIETRKLYKYDL